MKSIINRWKLLFKQRVDAELTLRLLTSLCALLGILVVLFSPIITRQDEMLLKPVDLSGMNILSSIGFSNITYYQMGNALTIDIPVYLVVAVLLIIALLGLVILLNLFFSKMRKATGYLSLACSIGMVLFFILTMVFDVTKTNTIFQQEVVFYKIFSFTFGYAVSLICSVFGYICGAVVKRETLPKIRKFWFLYFLLAIPMVLLAIFAFYPMLLQTVMSFKEYKAADGIWGSEWVGFTYFKEIFTEPNMGRIIWNTVYISFLRLLSGLLPPIILAIAVFEMTNKFLRGAVQTITYIPHFFSWVIIYAIVFAFLSPGGIVNNILMAYSRETIDFLTNEDAFIPILIISAIWKELGWSTIIYLAALGSVDTDLYDAAAIDGIGPLRKLRYITLPAIMPVIVFTTIMAVGNILKGAGGEQILMFANGAVMNKAEVIDTWMYWKGLGDMQYGLGAAMSFFQSAIGIVMVLAANKLSVKFAGRGLW